MHTVVYARFPFSYEVDPVPASARVGHEPREGRGIAHLVLLQALPPVRVGEDENDLALYLAPKRPAVGDALNYILAGAREHILEEVSENLDDRFACRERGKILLDSG